MQLYTRILQTVSKPNNYYIKTKLEAPKTTNKSQTNKHPTQLKPATNIFSNSAETKDNQLQTQMSKLSIKRASPL